MGRAFGPRTTRKKAKSTKGVRSSRGSFASRAFFFVFLAFSSAPSFASPTFSSMLFFASFALSFASFVFRIASFVVQTLSPVSFPHDPTHLP
jgi:hypothetical protein